MTSYESRFNVECHTTSKIITATHINTPGLEILREFNDDTQHSFGLLVGSDKDVRKIPRLASTDRISSRGIANFTLTTNSGEYDFTIAFVGNHKRRNPIILLYPSDKFDVKMMPDPKVTRIRAPLDGVFHELNELCCMLLTRVVSLCFTEKRMY